MLSEATINYHSLLRIVCSCLSPYVLYASSIRNHDLSPFPQQRKKKKKIPRHLHSFTSIKILANESTNSTPFQLKSPPARGEKKGEISDQSWRSILFEKKKTRARRILEMTKKADVRGSLLSSLFLLHWVRIRGKEAGNRISEKGKATRDAGCLCVARLYTHPRECDKLYEEAGTKG